MLKDLVKIANSLDQKGLMAEANYLDQIIKLAAEGKTNLELLDDAISILNTLRMEMDPDFGPEPGDEGPPDEFYDEMLRAREEEKEGRALMEDARLRKDFDLD